MTRSELIEKIVGKTNLPNQAIELAVRTMFNSMSDAMIRGERIEIRDFGSFVARHYSARRSRNPRTGESVDVPAKRRPFFKVGKELAERVDHKRDSNVSDQS